MTWVLKHKTLILVTLGICLALTAVLVFSTEGKQEGAFIYQVF